MQAFRPVSEGAGEAGTVLVTHDECQSSTPRSRCWTGGEALLTTALIELEGRTIVTMTVEYASPEARARVLKTGMEGGMASCFDMMDGLLASLT